MKESEEDKNILILLVTMLAANDKVRPFWWVIDREKEIIMTEEEEYLGTYGDFSIYYEKQFINIELVRHESGDYAERI